MLLLVEYLWETVWNKFVEIWWKKITQKGGPETQKSHFPTKNTIFLGKNVNKVRANGRKGTNYGLK